MYIINTIMDKKNNEYFVNVYYVCCRYNMLYQLISRLNLQLLIKIVHLILIDF